MLPYLRLIKGLKRRPTSARKYSTTAQADELPGIVAQRVFVGPNAVSSMKAASKYTHPLLVSDNGIVSLGIFGEFRTTYFNNSHFFTQVQPNPSVANVLSIHDAYLLAGADGIVGTSINCYSLNFGWSLGLENKAVGSQNVTPEKKRRHALKPSPF
jgi:hypothetical protein